MQINSKFPYFSSSKNVWWIKTVLLLILLFLLYKLLNEKIKHFEEIKQSFDVFKSTQNQFLIVLVIAITPINWAFEALKWQKLVSKVERISFFEAYRGVLIGLTFATATPMMIGDYAGKILMLKSNKRLESIGAVLLGNSLQLYTSLLFGTISYSLFIFWSKPSFLIFHIIIVSLFLVSLTLGFILARNLPNLNQFLSKNKWLSQLKPYIGILENYSIAETKVLLLIAIGRYLIFSTQFYLMFHIFQVDLSASVLWVGIGLIFLGKTVASVLNFLGDLSIRELTSIYYFSYFGANLAAVSSATFTIWLVNVLLPIIFGIFFIIKIRLIP
ncbi:hypothetical protein Emtol_1218 [Emticicia oligotrophica DSM 17448]|uniref:Flippase-like domain-containing protein n=1 Tax=Emticicia oligotrophica (strain DSM 17448 / CIP 109782 / MTCC 6937 / GPTSA100-15) TaxID=929562 RepID=A0ABM5MYX2_EMTOG|nr:lysylphosphatidylglycerol synthase domain-containing protein [Emticicia oligotrophica]AFK02367.1 hypothetical protein Emtol_1218 [Emticicia oligotrophica DSM 17448]